MDPEIYTLNIVWVKTRAVQSFLMHFSKQRSFKTKKGEMLLGVK